MPTIHSRCSHFSLTKPFNYWRSLWQFKHQYLLYLLQMSIRIRRYVPGRAHELLMFSFNEAGGDWKRARVEKKMRKIFPLVTRMQLRCPVLYWIDQNESSGAVLFWATWISEPAEQNLGVFVFDSIGRLKVFAYNVCVYIYIYIF